MVVVCCYFRCSFAERGWSEEAKWDVEVRVVCPRPAVRGNACKPSRASDATQSVNATRLPLTRAAEWECCSARLQHRILSNLLMILLQHHRLLLLTQLLRPRHNQQLLDQRTSLNLTLEHVILNGSSTQEPLKENNRFLLVLIVLRLFSILMNNLLLGLFFFVLVAFF